MVKVMGIQSVIEPNKFITFSVFLSQVGQSILEGLGEEEAIYLNVDSPSLINPI
jgi:hypothetical protein